MPPADILQYGSWLWPLASSSCQTGDFLCGRKPYVLSKLIGIEIVQSLKTCNFSQIVFSDVVVFGHVSVGVCMCYQFVYTACALYRCGLLSVSKEKGFVLINIHLCVYMYIRIKIEYSNTVHELGFNCAQWCSELMWISGWWLCLSELLQWISERLSYCVSKSV